MFSGGGVASSADGQQKQPPVRDPNTNGDVAVPNSPADSISCLAWSPTQNLLAAGSWDKSVSVWEVQENGGSAVAAPRVAYGGEAPVLCCGFSRDGHQLVSGGCDHKVRIRDLQAQRDVDLGSHAAPVKELAVLDDLNLVVSGGWDKALHLWSAQQPAPVLTLQLPERVYAMDVKFPILVVGTADRHLLVYNLQDIQRNPAPTKAGFTQLKMQTRSLAVFPDRGGYIVGSIEGRCGVTYFSDTSSSFCFKCHRTTDTINAVNAIDFHPEHGTFATCGSDGNFVFWDKERRQRLKQFSSCFYPITAGKFNPSGSLFAYAVSYDWSQGHEVWNAQLPRQVLLHRCQSTEVMPRGR